MNVLYLLLLIVFTSIIALYWLRPKESFSPDAFAWMAGNAVAFYPDCEYKGTTVFRQEGTYENINAMDMGSISIPPGWKVTITVLNRLATLKNGTNTLVLTEDMKCFGDHVQSVVSNYNWRWIHSMTVKVERVPIKDTRPKFFTESNYGGETLILSPGSHNSAKLGTSHSGKISSVLVPPGNKVTMYTSSPFKGDSIVLTKDEPNLQNVAYNKNNQILSWNDRVRSIIVEKTS